MPGDSSCSQCVEPNAREVVIPDGGEGRATRSRELTRRVWHTRKRISERGERRSRADY